MAWCDRVVLEVVCETAAYLWRSSLGLWCAQIRSTWTRQTRLCSCRVSTVVFQRRHVARTDVST